MTQSTRETPRLRRLFALLALVLAVAALGACGDDEEEGGDGVGAPTTEQPADDGGSDDGGSDDGATDDTEPPGGATVVKVQNFQFDPESITVAVGDTVTWQFEDGAPHNVSADDFESENLSSGEEFSHTFDEAGSFEYVCTLHPGMEGTVEVS